MSMTVRGTYQRLSDEHILISEADANAQGKCISEMQHQQNDLSVREIFSTSTDLRPLQ
jgi:hypothetical protein